MLGDNTIVGAFVVIGDVKKPLTPSTMSMQTKARRSKAVDAG